jgi:hypothetical protein
MSVAEAVQTNSKASSSSSSGFVVQRKCACGGPAGFTGECEECRRKKFLGKPLRRTLAINEPDDEQEREADRVAERVMRIAEPARTSRGTESPASSLVQGRVNGPGTGGVGTAPPLVQEVLASPGQPPDASARAFLEPRFGQSLDDVRLHTDTRAHRAAKSVHARAFTVGRHIVFGGGEYVPHSITSTLLLAHELTHVIQQAGGASILARKSSAAGERDEGVVAVAESVAGDEVESAVDVAGASSRGELSRLSAAIPDERREEEGKAVLVEERPFPQAAPAGVSDVSATRATLAEAAVEPSAPTPAQGVEIGIGTPSETGRRFSVLPPSVQAGTYRQLGAELSASFTNQALETQAAIPELSASLDGATELPATPVVATPPLIPSAAGQAFASTPEPVVKIPKAPAPIPVSQPTLPTAQVAEPEALDKALGAIDQAPAITATPEIPDIPLEGKTDPAALGTLESAATGEAARALDAAQAGVMDVSPELVQPLELDEAVAVPALTDVHLPERTPQVEGMDKLAGYALSPRDRAIVDARVGPSMQEAATGVQLELDQHEQAFDQERTRLHLEADSEAAAAQARAEEDQQFEVEQGRQDLAAEQARTLAQQQAAVDGALDELAMSRDASRHEIDDRLATDRATVDEIYKAAEADVQTEVEKGHARTDAVKGATADRANAESWWDWTIDAWQGFVQWFAANLVAIWEDVNQIVAGLFDRAIQLATEVVHGAVAFVKQAISAYYDLWLSLADKLLGNVFPELAAALRTAIEELKARVFEALDAVATGYLQALRVVADALVAGLDAGVQAYKMGVAAYLALWEAIQHGQWDQAGRTVLTAILTAAGIDPEEFFATFSKFDEVVDDVIADPGLVGRNAVAALGLGFTKFGTNFIGNFTAAFVEWITGAAAIVLPKTFSLAGIFYVVCQILNLTKSYLHQKAVQHLGQGSVTAIEELTDAAWTLVAGGWEGLWNLVKDKLTTLVDDVVVATGTWLVEKAILVVGRWIAGLAATMGISVIFEALIALWQFVMWLKDQFHRFWMIVKSTIDSVHEFVKGNIEPAATKIEGTLQDLIVPAIDLVAKLLNISNIAKKVEHIIEAVRGVIDRAVDGVIERLKKTLKSGARKVKAKAGEVAGKLLNWWDARSDFKDASGEAHRLFYKGEGRTARLYVASSNPSQIVPFLTDRQSKLREIPKPTNYDESDVERARDCYVKEVQPKENPSSEADVRALEKALAKLGVFFRKLFHPGMAKDFPPPKLPVMADNVQARGFTAHYIVDAPGYAYPVQMGTISGKHAGQLRGHQALEDTGLVGTAETQYMKMHLLPHKLGGDAVDSNLTPAMQKTNKKFSSDLERYAKEAAVEGPEDEREPIWYRFGIDYYPPGLAANPTKWKHKEQGKPAPRFLSDAYASALHAEWGRYTSRAESSTKITRATTPSEPIPQGPKYTYEKKVPLPGYDTEGSPQAIVAGVAVGQVSQHYALLDNLLKALGILYPIMPEVRRLKEEAITLLDETEKATADSVRTQRSEQATHREDEVARMIARFVRDSQLHFTPDDGKWSPVVVASLANYTEPLARLSAKANALKTTLASLGTRHPEITGVDEQNLSRLYRFFAALQRVEYANEEGVADAVIELNKPHGELKNRTPVEAISDLNLRKPGINELAGDIGGLTDERFAQVTIADRMQDALQNMINASQEGRYEALRTAVARANEAFLDLEKQVRNLESQIERLEHHVGGFRVGLEFYSTYRNMFKGVSFEVTSKPKAGGRQQR